MVTLLITSFLLLAGITYAVYLWQRPSSKTDAGFSLPPPRTVGLFDDDLNEARELKRPDVENTASEQRRALLARASAGDKEALRDAHANADAALYDEVLNVLVERADSEKRLLALVSYIARSDAHLRVNSLLAEKFIESYARAIERTRH